MLTGSATELSHPQAVVEAVAQLDLRATEVAVCEDWVHGISASLQAGLAARGDVDWALVTLGDQPLVTSRAIGVVADAARHARPATHAVRATFDGRPGHPVVVHRALFAGIERLRGDRGARELLQRVRTRHVEVGGLCSDIDVDEPGDLEAVIASRRSAREDGPARR